MTVKELKDILNTMDEEKEITMLNLSTDYGIPDYERYVSDYEIDDAGDLILK